MPPMSADSTNKKKSWLSYVVGPRVRKHAMLAKRTTDDERPYNLEDFNEGTDAGKGPVIYSSDQLTTYRDQYNAAKEASKGLRKKLQKAKAAGLEVSQDDIEELSRLSAVTNQQRMVLQSAQQGQPLDRRTTVRKLDVASLMQDPEIQELAKSGVYNARQLAEYKHSFLEALRRANAGERHLAKVAEVRKVTEAEEKEVADLQSAYNLQRKIWKRVRAGKPAEYRVHRPKQSVDDLLKSPKLHEIAQSSGYSVEELAEAKRSLLDAQYAARSFNRKLAEVRNARQVTDDEATQMQTLWEVVRREERVFDQMSKARGADGGAPLPRKSLTALLQDAEVQRIAQLGGYSLEEVAAQKRRFLDAKYEYIAAQKLIAAIKNERRSLTREEEVQFTKTDDTYHLQKTKWERMSKGERVEAVPLPPKRGHLGKEVAALRQTAKVDEMAHPVADRPQPPITYTPQQIAMYHQRHLDALDDLLAFQAKISAAGRPLTDENEQQLEELRDVYNQRRAEWKTARERPSGASASQDVSSVTYTAEQLAAYNEAHLDALSRLRAFEKIMAAARHPPTSGDEAQRQALRDDYNEMKTIWNRARKSKPVDRKVYSRRAGSRRTSAESQESRPGTQEPPGKTEADQSTNQALQMAAHRLFAPVLSSARHFLHGLGRQWRAMPWTRDLAHPRVDKVKPTELLRAEPAL
ncbi:MAG: hypothetical protein M1826_003467 [Phylliscum demangeonii]|nr:MAG: hypothetical protein M1826_003467 [Phylliscum demangeonii]